MPLLALVANLSVSLREGMSVITVRVLVVLFFGETEETLSLFDLMQVMMIYGKRKQNGWNNH